MPESEYLICGQAVSAICDALEITPEHLLTGKGIDPEYKDTDMDYEITRAYMKAFQKLEVIESIVEEYIHNPKFNYIEFEAIKNEAGLNSFVLTPNRWVNTTNAIGTVTKGGGNDNSQSHGYP